MKKKIFALIISLFALNLNIFAMERDIPMEDVSRVRNLTRLEESIRKYNKNRSEHLANDILDEYYNLDDEQQELILNFAQINGYSIPQIFEPQKQIKASTDIVMKDGTQGGQEVTKADVTPGKREVFTTDVNQNKAEEVTTKKQKTATSEEDVPLVSDVEAAQLEKTLADRAAAEDELKKLIEQFESLKTRDHELANKFRQENLNNQVLKQKLQDLDEKIKITKEKLTQIGTTKTATQASKSIREIRAEALLKSSNTQLAAEIEALKKRKQELLEKLKDLQK